MRWKNFLIGTAFAGVIGFATMFTPIGDPLVTSNAAEPKNGNVMVEAFYSDEFICPLYEGGQRRSAEHRMGRGPNFSESTLTVLTEELGMTAKDLQAARHAGKSIAQLAEEKNVSVEQLKTALFENRKKVLEQLVADGIITQERMDRMLENMNAMIETAIQREHVGPMNGQRGKMHHPMNGRWNAQANN